MSGWLRCLIKGRLENLQLFGLNCSPGTSSLGSPRSLLVLVTLGVLVAVPVDGALGVVHEIPVGGGVGHGRRLVQPGAGGETGGAGEAQQTGGVVVVGLAVAQLGLQLQVALVALQAVLLLQLVLVVVERVCRIELIIFLISQL